MEVDTVVGFVDIVGYTSLSRRIALYELEDLLEGFEENVHEVVAADALDAKVDELLKALTSASPAAVVACKTLVADVVGRDIDEGLIAYTVEAIADIRASAEGREGVQAFLNKRKPAWLL